MGPFDAVVVGLGSMIGAGVFAALAPAAAAAGSGLLVGLGVAAVVAACNASSSARLAARHPASGGTYVYGRERLGAGWGFLAGWGFVVGKTASCAAMGLTFGAYVAPEHTRALAVGAVVVLTGVNLLGVRKTAALTTVVVALVLGALAVVVTACLTADPSTAELGPFGAGGLDGILEAAGFLFFAFAGYARVATLGEEVRDPARTIPRAITVALAITLVVYAAVALAALLAVGPDALAVSATPLEAAVDAGTLAWAAPVVRIGAAVACLGVLLTLLAGVSRTTFAMAAERDLPRWLDAVHGVRRVPHRAELAVGVAAVTVILIADVRGAIGFSAFTVLAYYTVTNASALTLPAGARWVLRTVALLGLLGCVALALALPASSLLSGATILAVGVLARAVLRRGERAADGDESRATGV